MKELKEVINEYKEEFKSICNIEGLTLTILFFIGLFDIICLLLFLS